MVRRSTVDRSPPQATLDADADRGDLSAERGDSARLAATRWRGAGGRWLVWVFRVVVWAVLLVVGYRGVTAIIFNEVPPTGTGSPATAGTGFPVTLADAYALQFGQIYLNASPGQVSARGAELARFLPDGMDTQLGYSGSGTLLLDSEQVAATNVSDAHHAVVTLLARVNGRLMELGVPIYASGNSMVVSGAPALLPPPPRASLPVPVTPPATDTATQATLQRQLPPFFRAYAAGDTLTMSRFEAPGANLRGLNGLVQFASLSGVAVPPGGTTRHVVASVVWRVPSPASGRTPAGAASARLDMSYTLAVVQSHGTWYVQSISSSAPVEEPP